MSEPRFEVAIPPDVIEEIVERVVARVLVELRSEQASLVSIDEAARRVGLSSGALRKHVARGHLRSVRLGGRLLVDLGSIEEA